MTLQPDTIPIGGVYYPYSQWDNTVKINGIRYEVDWVGQQPIIIDIEGNRIDALPPADKSTTIAITNHMVCLAREGRAEHICFLLALRATETYPLPKTFKNVAKLLPNSKKRWLESCLEELKSLGDRDVMKLWIFLRKEKWSRTARCLISSLMVIINLILLPKDFLKLKALTLMNYSLQLSTMKLHCEA